MVLLITYDLNNEKNYNSLYKGIGQLGDAIKDPGLDSVWFVSTVYTTEQASNHLRNFIDKDDRLFISKINAGERDGWLAQSVWDWITKNQ